MAVRAEKVAFSPPSTRDAEASSASRCPVQYRHSVRARVRTTSCSTRVRARPADLHDEVDEAHLELLHRDRLLTVKHRRDRDALLALRVALRVELTHDSLGPEGVCVPRLGERGRETSRGYSSDSGEAIVMRPISSSARLGRVGDVRGVENADERDVLVVGVRHVHAGRVEESTEQVRPHAPTPSARRGRQRHASHVRRATRDAGRTIREVGGAAPQHEGGRRSHCVSVAMCSKCLSLSVPRMRLMTTSRNCAFFSGSIPCTKFKPSSYRNLNVVAECIDSSGEKSLYLGVKRQIRGAGRRDGRRLMTWQRGVFLLVTQRDFGARWGGRWATSY